MTAEDARTRALAALDRAMDEPPADAKDDLTEAVRSVAALRDELAGAWRRTEAAEDRRRLDAVNAILSLLAGLEYPLGGMKWKRLGEARDSLRTME